MRKLDVLVPPSWSGRVAVDSVALRRVMPLGERAGRWASGLDVGVGHGLVNAERNDGNRVPCRSRALLVMERGDWGTIELLQLDIL